MQHPLHLLYAMLTAQLLTNQKWLPEHRQRDVTVLPIIVLQKQILLLLEAKQGHW